MRYKLVMGDWSGDGHARSEDYYVNIPDSLNLTIEDLRTNYEKNVAKTGFGYEVIANRDYYAYISIVQIEALKKLGLNFVEISNEDSYKINSEENLSTIFIVDEYEPEYFVLNTYNPVIELIKIIMFMISNGIEDFTWELEQNIDTTPVLVGGFGAVSNENAGYGIFMD